MALLRRRRCVSRSASSAARCAVDRAPRPRSPPAAGRRARAALAAMRAVELLDFALARKHAVQLGIGRVEAHAVPRVDMAFARDEHRARRAARCARGKPARGIGHARRPGAAIRRAPARAAGRGRSRSAAAARTPASATLRRRRACPAAGIDDGHLAGRRIAEPVARRVRASSSAMPFRRSRSTASSASSQPGSIAMPCHRRGAASSPRAASQSSSPRRARCAPAAA